MVSNGRYPYDRYCHRETKLKTSSLSGLTVTPPIRCISIDVEEYFQIEAAHATIKRDRWCQRPSRIESNMDRLLELFDAAGCHVTMFVLGHIAELHPQLIRRCSQAGHEIASHGL